MIIYIIYYQDIGEKRMKRVLVLSDSHGNVGNMIRAVKREEPDMILHLGDCVVDADALRREFPHITMVNVPENDILYALDAIQTPLSLFDPVYTDGGDTLYVMDQISDKKNKEEAWVKNLVLDDALKLLDDRARQIIKLRFFEGKTQIEVAEEINISQAQVSRLEKNALKNMHGYLEA
jgi:RNA polymerase sigma factor (sigma-70 family)